MQTECSAEQFDFGIVEGREVVATAPTPRVPQSYFPHFKFRLSMSDGTDRYTIGWLGKAGTQDMWACVVPDEIDAVIMRWWIPDNDPAGGPQYLWIENFGYMTWSGGLPGYPVAFNTWAYANKWDMIPGTGVQAAVIAADSKAPLCQYQVGTSPLKWIYANASGPPYNSTPNRSYLCRRKTNADLLRRFSCVMPNGEPLRECTFAEVATFGARLSSFRLSSLWVRCCIQSTEASSLLFLLFHQV
jgi:hypothetical protein